MSFYFSLFAARRATILAVAMLICATSPVIAQSGGDNPANPGSTDPEAKAAPSALGGFFSRIGSSIESVVSTGSRTKPQIAEVKQAPYAASNEALGDSRDVSEQRLRGFGLVSLPSLTDYANAVLGRLKAESGVTGVPGHVLLVTKPGLEAASTPDGNILVSLDWFNNLSSEDELAALLAHELAHILQHHHDSNLFGRLQKQGQLLLAMGFQVSANLDRLTTGAATAKLTPNQLGVLQKMEVYIKLTDQVLHPAWNRRQELEADRLAIDLIQRAKYSYSNGFKNWLEKIRSWDAEQDAKRLVIEQDSQRVVQELMLSGKFDQGLQRGVGDAFKSVVDQLALTHDGGEKRVDEAQLYVEAIYPDMAKQSATTVPFLKLMNEPANSRVLKAYKQTFEAQTAITNGNYASAAKTLTPLLARNGPIANHAVPNYLMYEALAGLGRKKEAVVYLSKSLEAPDPAWKPFSLAADYYKNEDASKITGLGQMALARFEQAPALYPQLVGMYARTGQAQAMQQAQSECLLKYIQYRDDCNRAAKSN